jgi:hypothetical protein
MHVDGVVLAEENPARGAGETRSQAVPLAARAIKIEDYLANRERAGEKRRFPPANSVSKTKQKVPGGVIGLTGQEPEFGFDEELEILQLTNGIYVDNAFAAPGASGCVLKLFGFIPISLNGFVNSQAGLPSPAGTNETVQEFDFEAAAVSRVYP